MKKKELRKTIKNLEVSLFESECRAQVRENQMADLQRLNEELLEMSTDQTMQIGDLRINEEKLNDILDQQEKEANKWRNKSFGLAINVVDLKKQADLHVMGIAATEEAHEAEIKKLRFKLDGLEK